MSTLTWRTSRGRRYPAALALAALAATAVAAAGTTDVPASRTPTAGQIAPMGTLRLLDGKWGDKTSDSEALAGDKVTHPEADPGSLYTVTKAIGARKVWKQKGRSGQPLTGAGVTVALLDSGVASVPGLDTPGQVTYGPDLSAGERTDGGAQDPFGHGTFMAGLIAARDPAVDNGKAVPFDSTKPELQEGLAPGAGLLSLKLADADGSTSVEAVITALDWVVRHRDDNGMNVRVVNLSFGAEALQPYQSDPLAAAAERAWRAGIVVVASVGNDGPAASGVVDPALDPFVIAVGASDPQQKKDGWNKPVVADFSSRGTEQRHADVLAPGTSVVSLRVPGSAVDTDNPQGRVAGDQSGRLFRGSGTSEATAVVSGSVALLLQAHPELTPDQVKALLMQTATQVDASPLFAGSGQIDLEAALKAADKIGTKDDRTGLAGVTQSYPVSTGLDGADLGAVEGAWDGARWKGARWRTADWSGARWKGARWRTSTWS